MGIYAALGEALATAPRIRMAAVDRSDGSDITGEIVRNVSETHVIFRSDDGLEFTLPMTGLRVITPAPAPAAADGDGIA